MQAIMQIEMHEIDRLFIRIQNLNKQTNLFMFDKVHNTLKELQ